MARAGSFLGATQIEINYDRSFGAVNGVGAMTTTKILRKQPIVKWLEKHIGPAVGFDSGKDNCWVLQSRYSIAQDEWNITAHFKDPLPDKLKTEFVLLFA